MRVWKIKDADGITEKHAESGTGTDYTLCGLNVIPDNSPYGNEGAISCIKSDLVSGRINCQRCIEIIEHCKKIPAKSIRRRGEV